MKGKMQLCVVTLMLAAVVSSCEKMVIGQGAESEMPSNVVLRVSHFEQIPFEAATRASMLSAVCTRLNFIIYDEDGERVRQVQQHVEDEDFGQAGVYLPKGTYYLVVLAHSSDGNPTSTNAQKIAFTNSTGYTDTFFYGGELTVGDEDVDRTLQLKRIVAMVRFVFEDKIPAKADRIRFYYEGGSGTLDATADGWGVVKSKQGQFYDLTHTESQFDIYTIPWQGDDGQLKVTVSTYQTANDNLNTISERVISGIPIKRNYITTCRGKIFSTVSNASLQVTISTDWLGSLDWPL